MGYQVPWDNRVLALDFSETDYAGAQVKCNAETDVGTWLYYTKQLQESNEEGNFIAGCYELVRNIVIEWNLEDSEGNPLPISDSTLKALPRRFIVAIVNAWQRAYVEVNNPLGETSPNGSTSQEATITQLASMSESLGQ